MTFSLKSPESWQPVQADVEKLTIHPSNIRKENPENEVPFLMNSIKELWGGGVLGTGVIHPIMCDTQFRVVLGQRRVIAMKKLFEITKDEKYKSIPAFVLSLNDRQALVLSMTDTCQYVDTEMEDKIRGVDALHDLLAEENPSFTEKQLTSEIIRVTGLSESRVISWLRQRKWPMPISELFRRDLVSFSEGDILVKVWNRSKELRDFAEEKERGIVKDLLIGIAKGIKQHTLDDMKGTKELKLRDIQEMLKKPEPPEEIRKAIITGKISERAEPEQPKPSEDKGAKKTRQVQFQVKKKEEEEEDKIIKASREPVEVHTQIPTWAKERLVKLVEEKYRMTLPVYLLKVLVKWAETGKLPEV